MKKQVFISLILFVVLFSTDGFAKDRRNHVGGRDKDYYSDEWIDCAKEGGYCSFHGAAIVRFGLGNNWTRTEFSDGVNCSTRSFGRDPIEGHRKICQYKSIRRRPQVGGWIDCAKEGGYCSFSGDAIVRFGLGNSWATTEFSDGVTCSTRAFGRDPIEGHRKICQYKSIRTRPQSGRWVKCADENGYCYFNGFKTVRYGAGHEWTTYESQGGFQCDNDTLGDPAPGIGKACYYWEEYNYRHRRNRW